MTALAAWFGKDNLLCLATLPLIGGFLLLTLRPGQEWGDDFALYVGHARNLAEGRPYADTGYVYNPHYPSIATRTYPPVFPLLLTPVYWLFGLNLMAMKAYVILLFLAAIWIVGLILRRHLPLPYALGCLLLIGLNPLVWQLKDRLLSEMPYMLFLYLSLWLIEKSQEASDRRWRALLWAVLAGVTAYLAYGTRSPGMVLIPSLVACHIFNRQLGWTTLAIVGSFTGCFLLQMMLLQLDTSARDQLALDLVGFVTVGISLFKAQGMFLSNGHSDAIRLTLYLICLVLAVGGFLLHCGRRWSVYVPLVVFSLLLLCFWPYALWNSRYLLPLLPLFFFFIAVALHRLRSSPVARLVPGLAGALMLAVLLTYAANYAQREFGPIQNGVDHPHAVALFNYVRESTDSEDVFIFARPKAFALYTGRKASALHRESSDEALWDYLRLIGANHVVLASEQFAASQSTLAGFVERNFESFRLRYENEGYLVYQITVPSTALASSNR